MAAVITRRAIEAAVARAGGEDVAIPASTVHLREHLRSGMKHPVTLRVNGIDYPVEVEGHQSLLDAVRDVVGLTGSKEGCDDSECGACMMLLDGVP